MTAMAFLAQTAQPSAAQDALPLQIGGTHATVPVESYKSRQFSTVIRQQTDFSCGSASLASLLTHHYGLVTTEADTFTSMWKHGDQQSIRERGFSLLDMKAYLARRGMLADGYQLPLQNFEGIGIPAIALINVEGYKHFVVIKGIKDDRILIGDPSRGLIVKTVEEFEQVWDGTVFFIRSFVETGRSAWNRSVDWAAHPKGRPADRLRPASPAEAALHAVGSVDSAFSLTARF